MHVQENGDISGTPNMRIKIVLLFGWGKNDSPADDVGLHLGHARPLDEVVELTHGGVARQVL